MKKVIVGSVFAAATLMVGSSAAFAGEVTGSAGGNTASVSSNKSAAGSVSVNFYAPTGAKSESFNKDSRSSSYMAEYYKKCGCKKSVEKASEYKNDNASSYYAGTPGAIKSLSAAAAVGTNEAKAETSAGADGYTYGKASATSYEVKKESSYTKDAEYKKGKLKSLSISDTFKGSGL